MFDECEALLKSFEASHHGCKVIDVLRAIYEDSRYQALSADDKALFAMMLAAKSRYS